MQQCVMTDVKYSGRATCSQRYCPLTHDAGDIERNCSHTQQWASSRCPGSVYKYFRRRCENPVYLWASGLGCDDLDCSGGVGGGEVAAGEGGGEGACQEGYRGRIIGNCRPVGGMEVGVEKDL